MTKITEIRGTLFSVTLADNTTLTLQSGESKTIKNELVGDSVRLAESMKCISVKEVSAEKKTSSKKNGGVVEDEQ